MIQVEGVKKEYGRFRIDADISVKSGRVTGLIGRNGAGKTVLLRLIMGLIRPDEGRVRVFGREAADLRAEDRAQMAVVWQNAFLQSDLTVPEWSELQQILIPDFDSPAFLEACRELALPMETTLRLLTPGQRAAFCLLGALSRPAKLLVLDEPTVGLDVAAREILLDRLRQYLAAHEECSVLITSHISSDLEGLCDDFYLLEKGKIRLYAETDELPEKYAVFTLREEDFKAVDPSRILGLQKEHGVVRFLTDDRAFYEEKCPGCIVEPAGIDALVLLQEEKE